MADAARSSLSQKAGERIVCRRSLRLFVSTALLGFLHLMILGRLSLSTCLGLSRLPWPSECLGFQLCVPRYICPALTVCSFPSANLTFWCIVFFLCFNFLFRLPVQGFSDFSIRHACHLCVLEHANVLILASYHLSPTLGMDEALVSNKSFASAGPKWPRDEAGRD